MRHDIRADEISHGAHHSITFDIRNVQYVSHQQGKVCSIFSHSAMRMKKEDGMRLGVLVCIAVDRASLLISDEGGRKNSLNHLQDRLTNLQ